MLLPVGFASITVTTAEKHDEMIAYTSQLAHIVSNAYIKSPTVREHNGMSAGSYKDMTRVAWLSRRTEVAGQRQKTQKQEYLSSCKIEKWLPEKVRKQTRKVRQNDYIQNVRREK